MDLVAFIFKSRTQCWQYRHHSWRTSASTCYMNVTITSHGLITYNLDKNRHRYYWGHDVCISISAFRDSIIRVAFSSVTDYHYLFLQISASLWLARCQCERTKPISLGEEERQAQPSLLHLAIKHNECAALLLTSVHQGWRLDNHPSHLLFLHSNSGNQDHHLAAGWSH